jgi:predicted nucleic acid-binding protein
MGRWLIDTSIFIDYLRGYAPAVAWLNTLQEPGLVSAVTYAELFAGVSSKHAERAVEKVLGSRRVVRIDAHVARRAGVFRRLYAASHSVEALDALIAACAEAEGATLATRNVMHFPMLSAVEAPY